MAPATPPIEGTGHRPSRVVAEALVKRWGPKRIAVRANRLGFPAPLTEAMVVACSAAAIDTGAGSGPAEAAARRADREA